MYSLPLSQPSFAMQDLEPKPEGLRGHSSWRRFLGRLPRHGSPPSSPGSACPASPPKSSHSPSSHTGSWLSPASGLSLLLMIVTVLSPQPWELAFEDPSQLFSPAVHVMMTCRMFLHKFIALPHRRTIHIQTNDDLPAGPDELHDLQTSHSSSFHTCFSQQPSSCQAKRALTLS